MATVKDLEKRIEELEAEVKALRTETKTEVHNHYHYSYTQPSSWPYQWFYTNGNAAAPGSYTQTFN